MKLKLVKGRSYNTKRVKVTAEKPFFETTDSKLANMLVESGYFVAVNEPKAINENKETPIEKMTEKELEEYAAKNNIDLTGLTKKAEKLAKIQEALKKTDEETDGGNNSGDIDFNLLSENDVSGDGA